MPNSDGALTSIVRGASAAYSTDSFPAITRLSAFDKIERNPDDPWPYFEYETLNERDVIVNKTRSMPFQLVGGDGRSVMMHYQDNGGQERERFGALVNCFG